MKISVQGRRPPDVVRALVRFAAREMEVTDYVREVRVTGTRDAYRGRCWGRRVLVRVGASDSWFPLKGISYPGLATAPTYDIADWVEAVVMVAAHEFAHSRQFRKDVPKSEVQAERAALFVLQKFRECRDEILEPAVAAGWQRQERVRAAADRAPVRAVLALEVRLKLWRTKAKRAANLVKKYERRLARARRTLTPKEPTP